MDENKENEKKDVKVDDLAPKKDAKGGAARSADGSVSPDGGGSLDRARRNLDGGGNLDRGGQGLS